MGESIDFECHDCGAEDRIDSTSLSFIKSVAGWSEDEAKRCDSCLSEALAGTYIDLGIGSTSSHEFEADREQRQSDTTDDEIAEAKDTVPIQTGERFEHDGREVVALSMAPEAKHDLKQLPYQLAHPEYLQSKQRWTIDQSAVDRMAEHMEAEGWTVIIDAR